MTEGSRGAMVSDVADLRVGNCFAALPERFYTRLPARGPSQPRLLHANAEAAALLGLAADALNSQAFLALVAGHAPLVGGQTLAAVYSGHQFGVWAGQLGDGRAHLLGDVVGPQGRWELQLKGSGMTPYSRMGDGRAVLRSSVREYLAAEAMAGLGIPTTRSLALVTSDDPVRRETMETAAVVTRMAPSFVRFGSFEHWAAAGDKEALLALLDHVVDNHYPECRVDANQPLAAGRTALQLLAAVATRTARLMAQWQAVGFCHGVMNTDNMSILGLTLDYGPYGFMDGTHVGHICNHTDVQGRYAWNRQPTVGLWNLYRLAGALQPIVQDETALKAVLADYEAQFTLAFNRSMGAKIGLDALEGADDIKLVDDLLTLMHSQRADFTLTFRRLADAVRGDTAPVLALFSDPVPMAQWIERLLSRHAKSGSGIVDGVRHASSAHHTAAAMDAVNPLYVLRNHLAEQAILAAKAGDPSEIERLMAVLRQPFEAQPGASAYAELPPAWANELEISCSS